MNSLIKIEDDSIVSLSPEYKDMVVIVNSVAPAVAKTIDNFCKTQSAFMDNILTVSHPTPLRNIRQITAEMEKTNNALREAYFGNEKKKIEIEMKKRDLVSETDHLKVKMLEIEIKELESQLEVSSKYIAGAIRKLTNYSIQYAELMKQHELNETTFEEEEEKYHIMKAFQQALTAARGRNGMVDEGNMIYFQQLGINGTMAQFYISHYFKEEETLINQNKEPSYEMEWNFVNSMAEHFKGCSLEQLERKHMCQDISVALLKGETNES